MKEITEEQYYQLASGGSAKERLRIAFELRLLDKIDNIEPKIKWFKVWEKDKKYYFDYATYDSCD